MGIQRLSIKLGYGKPLILVYWLIERALCQTEFFFPETFASIEWIQTTIDYKVRLYN